jgi:threonine aldolase
MTALERKKLAKRRASPAPSNIHFLEMPEARATAAFERGRVAGIRLGRWKEGAIPFYVNATILRREIAEYVALFSA